MDHRAFSAGSGVPDRPLTAFGEFDTDAFLKRRELERQLRPPFLGVLDTSFFYGAFQSYLRWGGAPVSLQAAQQGTLRLFIATDTLTELFEKLNEFAQKLQVSRLDLEQILFEWWLPWISEVQLGDREPDQRLTRLIDRDLTDRPAGALASLLAPCIPLSTDRDFEALEVARPAEPVVAVKASIDAGQSHTELQGLVLMPVLPVMGVVGGARWAGDRLGIPPWAQGVIGAGAVAAGALAYRRAGDDRRARIRKGLGELLEFYGRQFAEAQEQQRQAIATLRDRIVPPGDTRTLESLILRELATADKPVSAQRLWEGLEPRLRPSVQTVREILRASPEAEVAGRGVWTFGLALRELLIHDG